LKLDERIGNKSPNSNFGMVQSAVYEWTIILFRGERVINRMHVFTFLWNNEQSYIKLA